jgi:S-DNA-T family DNA segregation ATPase FtsK/SpoIIIE
MHRILQITRGILFFGAAFLCISLLLQFLDYRNSVSAVNSRMSPSFLLVPGMVLYGAYGYSSVLIPLFLITAGILLLIPGWSIKWGIYLGGTVFPFFTIVAAEVLWNTIPRGGSLFLDAVKSIILILAAALIIAMEYILLGLIGDMIRDRKKGVLKDLVQTAITNLKTPDPVSSSSADLKDSKEPEVPVFVPEILTSETEPVIYPETDSMTEEERSWLFEENYLETPQEDKSAFDRWYRGLADESAADESVADTSAAEASSTDQSVVENPPIEQSAQNTEQSIQEPIPSDIPLTVEEQLFSVVEELDSDEISYLMDESPLVEDNLMEEEHTVPEPPQQDDATPIFLDLHWKDHEDENEALFDEPQMFEDDPELIDEDFYSEEEEQFLADPFSEAEQEPFYEMEEIPAEFAEDAAETAPLAAAALKTEDLRADVPETKTVGTIVPKKKKHYSVPVEGILNTYPDGEYWIIDQATQDAAVILKETLQEFNIQAEVIGIRKGPVITMFEILPAPGVRLSKIVALQDNISLRLAASSVRIVAPIPGKHAVGIEIPNRERAIVSFRELIDTDMPAFRKMEIPVVLGKDITGEANLLDLTTTPHLLIAGATGSGKSVCVNSIILSILYKRSPEDVKMILIDPKIVELKLYNDIPHLLAPVITEPKRAFQALQYCLCEMERRYAMLDRMGVRDIKSYNRRIIERNLAMEKLPYIVVIIDEFADLMSTTGKELESTVARLAAMSRAVGVHLVLATQRPSIDVITGLIKANIPTRIAFMVASKMDSRIIIDQVGSEKLLGKGDMLYASAVDPFPVRIQGTFVSEEEVENVVDYVKQYGEPEYIDEEMFFDDEEDNALDQSLFSEGDDPLYDKALEIVVQAGKASASYIQRRLKIGYNRAARLVEEMEERGIVGPANGSKPRDVVHVPAM